MGSSESVEDSIDWTKTPIQSLENAAAAFVWVVRHYYCFDRETRLEKSDAIDAKLAKCANICYNL